VKNKPT